MSMVLTERRGSVMILTLNNPAQYNALADGLMGDLRKALDGAIGDAAVRAILLTGAGKGFCAGAQLGGGNTFSAGEQIGANMRASINPLIERMRGSPKPIVVAVNGPASGRWQKMANYSTRHWPSRKDSPSDHPSAWA